MPRGRYRFARIWAAAMIVAGYVLGVGLIVTGIVAYFIDAARPKLGAQELLAVAIASVVMFLLAGLLIVAGQMVQVFLDLRRLLILIRYEIGRTRRIEPPAQHRSADPLIPKR